MIHADYLGWLAASLSFFSFSRKTMVAVRTTAIMSNVAFIAYGLTGHFPHVYTLHSLLLLMNTWRLHQMRDLLKQVTQVASGQFNLRMLLPYMKQQEFKAGTYMLKQGDQVNNLYLILEGRVFVERANVEIGQGELLGEMGVFTEKQQRSASVRCLTDVRVGSLSTEKFWQVFYQDPAFGTYVVKTIVGRLEDRLYPSRTPAPEPRSTAAHPAPGDVDIQIPAALTPSDPT